MAETWRTRAARGLSRYFERRRWPRLTLGFVVLLTGVAGFCISWTLLHLGLTTMWQRYPLAVLGAYIVFLGLLRVWVEIERAHFDPADPKLLEALDEKPQSPESSPWKPEKRSWLDWLDVPDFSTSDSLEGCAVGMLLGALVGLGILLVTAVAGAPVLLGEVAVDLLLVSILYRRLKIAEREHWLAAAVRRTWLHALAAAVLLALVGECVAILAPGSVSLGEAVRGLLGH